MLRLITVLALARISVAATTAPGTGYSDADSCPPPETTPEFGAVVTHEVLQERRARPRGDRGGGARKRGGAGGDCPGNVRKSLHERRGGLPDAGVGITKTRAGRAAAEEAPLARRLGEGEGEEVLFVTYENLTF